jgi:hypothetical protein
VYKSLNSTRSLVQHNREFYGFIRGGVPVEWRDGAGETRHAPAHVLCILSFIDHPDPTASQLLDDALVRDGLADELGGSYHWREC